MAVKRRSPNYPAINLQEAVQVVETLYQGTAQGRGVGRGEFTPQDAAGAWNYSSTTGPVKNRIAALRQYGLLEGKKGNNAKLSDRALTLVLRDPGAREHRDALRVAALDPDIFEELHQTRPDAADDALRQHLIVQRNFTGEGANRLIAVFRASMVYAGLDESAKVAAQDQNGQDGREDTMVEQPPDPPPADSHTRSVTIPLPGTRWATLHAPFPIPSATWDQMMDMLNALKPGLVSSESQGIADASDGYPCG